MSYSKIADQLDFLTPANLDTIELKARTLTLSQCLDILLLDKSELSKKDLFWAEKAHRKGEAEGIAQAGEKLFDGMGRRGGSGSALSYLNSLSERFQNEQRMAASGSGFNFNVSFDDSNRPAIDSDHPSFGSREH